MNNIFHLDFTFPYLNKLTKGNERNEKGNERSGKETREMERIARGMKMRRKNAEKKMKE